MNEFPYLKVGFRSFSFGGYSKRAPSPNDRLQVCSDCREMILQVVRAQRTAQRLQLTRQLYGSAKCRQMGAMVGAAAVGGAQEGRV